MIYRENSESRATGATSQDGYSSEAGANTWREVDFADPETGVWAPARKDRDVWMCREDGKRPYASWADDGYAHRDAIHLLRAHVADAESDTVDERLDTPTFAFDPEATDGTHLKRAVTGEQGRTSVLLDRNHHGALLHAPPSRTPT